MALRCRWISSLIKPVPGRTRRAAIASSCLALAIGAIASSTANADPIATETFLTNLDAAYQQIDSTAWRDWNDVVVRKEVSTVCYRAYHQGGGLLAQLQDLMSEMNSATKVA